jgi:hypothetical protein
MNTIGVFLMLFFVGFASTFSSFGSGMVIFGSRRGNKMRRHLVMAADGSDNSVTSVGSLICGVSGGVDDDKRVITFRPNAVTRLKDLLEKKEEGGEVRGCENEGRKDGWIDGRRMEGRIVVRSDKREATL